MSSLGSGSAQVPLQLPRFFESLGFGEPVEVLHGRLHHADDLGGVVGGALEPGDLDDVIVVLVDWLDLRDLPLLELERPLGYVALQWA